MSRAATPTPANPEQHLPWTRGEPRFERQWLVLGPLSPASVTPALLTALRTTPAAPDRPVAGAPAPWSPRTSWSDVLEVAEGAVSTEPRVVFVHAAVERTADGPAVLSLGVETTASVWVNGIEAGRVPDADVFLPDEERFPVRLHAGTNDILLQLTPVTAPCRLTLRVLEPGAEIRPITEIAAAVVERNPAELAVRVRTAEPHGAPVEVAVLAPGGGIVARREVERGELAVLPSGTWPDGPYDVRCSTTDAWGTRAVTYVAWIKGDVSAIVRRIEVAAKLPANDDLGLIAPMLASLVHERLPGAGEQPLVGAAALPLHSALMEFEELEVERATHHGRTRPAGFVRIAYVDEVDGSTQYCRAYLPAHYDPRKRWPLVLFLHGFNPANPAYPDWWSADQRHEDIAEKRDVIYLEPHGRGNAQYVAIGERDVLRCIAEAKRRFSVDEDRVYLTGESMGGSGTWLIGTRHPELFAAIAPTYGGWDLRVAPPAGSAPPPRDPFRLEQANSFRSLESLLNLPVLVQHGDADPAVPVANSRHAVRLLQRWGYDVRYHEFPGMGHEDLGTRDATVGWLLTHTRNAAPKRVRVRSTDLLGAAAYWLRVTRFDETMRVIAADAEFVASGRLRLDTDNVAAISLDLPAALQPPSGQALTVVWNGESRTTHLENGRATLQRTGLVASALSKRPGLEGPISDFWRTSFVVVVGTASDDPVMRLRCRQKAEAFRADWEAWQHHAPRVLDDTAVNADVEHTYNLLLIGGPGENAVSRRFAERLPLSVSRTGFVLQGRTFAASDAVAQVIYPSPAAPDHYLVMVAPTSADGLYFWNPQSWSNPFGYPTMPWDWVIQDGRRVDLGPAQSPEEAWVAAGMFDAAWQRDDAHVITGDASLRRAAKLRRAPAPDFAVDASVRARLAGRYQVNPYFGLVVTSDATSLAVSIVGSPPIPLQAESETEYAIPGTAAPIVFETTPDGRATALILYNDGRPVVAHRVE